MFTAITKKYRSNPGQFNYGLSRICFLGADLIEMTIGLKDGVIDHRIGVGLGLAVASSAFTFLLDEMIGMSVPLVSKNNIRRQNQIKNLGNIVGVMAGGIYLISGIALRNSAMIATGAVFTASPLVEFRRETHHWNPRQHKSAEPISIFIRRRAKTLQHNMLHHPPRVAAALNAIGFAMLPWMLGGVPNSQKTMIVILGFMGVYFQARAEGVQKNPRNYPPLKAENSCAIC